MFEGVHGRLCTRSPVCLKLPLHTYPHPHPLLHHHYHQHHNARSHTHTLTFTQLYTPNKPNNNNTTSVWLVIQRWAASGVCNSNNHTTDLLPSHCNATFELHNCSFAVMTHCNRSDWCGSVHAVAMKDTFVKGPGWACSGLSLTGGMFEALQVPMGASAASINHDQEKLPFFWTNVNNCVSKMTVGCLKPF